VLKDQVLILQLVIIVLKGLGFSKIRVQPLDL
jgi:hypothetical protein